MEGKGSQDNSSQLMFNTGGTSNHISHSAEDDLNQHFVVAAAGTDRSNAWSQWTYFPKSSHNNYVEYLTESSTNYLPKTAATEAVLTGGDYSPVNSMHDVNVGVNGIESTDRSFLFNDPRKACTVKPTNSSIGLDAKKVGIWRPENAVQQANKFATTQLHAESHASWTVESAREKLNNVSQELDPRVTLGVVDFLPKPQSGPSKQKAPATDRERRQRIADNLKALHELLPNPAEGSQAYVVDDIIDYIKYLQLQIKELSGSKLQDESSALPLIFHEGYGHYIKQQMLNEPLEEMMGKLLEEHPAAAAQLLENNGLYLLPTSLVEDLHQAILVFGAGIPPI